MKEDFNFSRMRIAMVLPGLHRVNRGAEVAFEAIAKELAKRPDVEVTLFGSGNAKGNEQYKFCHVDNVPRERFEHWAKFPIFRTEYVYEELTFLPELLKSYQPGNFDITLTCSYPFTNWFLRWRGGKKRPIHVYVTQNGDYPATSNNYEFRFFDCDGLVCTNPEYWEQNKDRWYCTLIPNGVDPTLFSPRQGDRSLFDLPENVPIVLMVSALIPSKRIVEGIQAVSKLQGFHLVVCGEGAEREHISLLGKKLLPGRFHLKKLPREKMPEIYRTADVFLHMSLDEPSANVYIEALATGLPIVTHNRKVTQWTLGAAGVLVDTLDELQVIEGIKQAVLSNSHENREARRAIVKERFSWAMLADQYHTFFKTLHSKQQIGIQNV
jgi:glycosyltransferase involved in cell wall biosynthesis